MGPRTSHLPCKMGQYILALSSLGERSLWCEGKGTGQGQTCTAVPCTSAQGGDRSPAAGPGCPVSLCCCLPAPYTWLCPVCPVGQGQHVNITQRRPVRQLRVGHATSPDRCPEALPCRTLGGLGPELLCAHFVQRTGSHPPHILGPLHSWRLC